MKIGIDIGGSHIASGIVEKDGKIVAKETKDINANSIIDGKNAEELILNTINEEIEKLLIDNDYTIGDITKIGIAIPGGAEEGKIKRLVNLHIENFDITKILKEKYNTNIVLKNDGKCAGIAEKKYGSLKRYSDCVFLCIGTGVGCAVFLDNDLLETNPPSGFELGHMVIEKNGVQCNCGRKGCYETYASMKRFKAEALKRLEIDTNINSEELQNYIRNNINDESVSSFVNEYLDNVNIGICNILTLFEAEAICFGGSFSYYEDIFLPKLKEKIHNELPKRNKKLDLLPAKLLNDAGIIGATEI